MSRVERRLARRVQGCYSCPFLASPALDAGAAGTVKSTSYPQAAAASRKASWDGNAYTWAFRIPQVFHSARGASWWALAAAPRRAGVWKSAS